MVVLSYNNVTFYIEDLLDEKLDSIIGDVKNTTAGLSKQMDEVRNATGGLLRVFIKKNYIKNSLDEKLDSLIDDTTGLSKQMEAVRNATGGLRFKKFL